LYRFYSASNFFSGELTMSSIRPGLLGKYNLLERLGQGGMAEVWKAFDERLQRHVAIKFMSASLQEDETFIARFVREARAIASLRHPNIVQVYDFETAAPGTEHPLAYMVMDYIEGATLSEYLSMHSRVQKFPTELEILSLFFSISEAVDYAHQNGVLHRDIKPANILLDRKHTARNPMGEPILTDFGIAKILGTSDGTLTNAVIGTPLYISPEQALGKPISAASDIYSLSVVLYEICTGKLPFTADNPMAIMQQHIMIAPVPPAQINPYISPALSAVILRGLAKDPTERFPSALLMATALAEALNLPLPTRPRQPISSPDIRNLPTGSADTISELPTHRLSALATPADIKVARPVVSAPITPSSIFDTPDSAFDDIPTVGGTPEIVVRHTPAPPEAPPTPAPATILPRRPEAPIRPRGRWIALTIGLLIIVLGSSLTAFFHFHTGTGTTNTAATVPAVIGHAFFTSSDAGNGSQNLGLNDTFQVQLTNIPQPTAGTQYYAWLLPDIIQTESNPRAIGTLTISGNIAQLPTPYTDPQHQNLIAQFSRFLVTEEPAQPAPQSPSLDTTLWRYYAEMPQSPPSSDCQGVINQLSALCHLRHLLSGDPEIAQANLKGGLNYWFLNNMEDVQHWAQEAVTHTDPTDIRHKIVDVLYMLDGRSCITQDIHTMGANQENVPDDANLGTIAAIPLLDCALTPNLPGYLTHIHNHLNAMIQAPGILKDQVTMGTQIATELNTIDAWLKDLQTTARQLLAMNDTQLMQTQGTNLRNQLSGQATQVLSGGTDTGTGQLQKGVASISDQIQQLATMDVTAYTGK
jgi:eukaryotic-like serine/threonine-protein kinase